MRIIVEGLSWNFGERQSFIVYPWRIELKQGVRVMAANSANFYSDGSSNTFHVFFDHPVQVEVGIAVSFTFYVDITITRIYN